MPRLHSLFLIAPAFLPALAVAAVIKPLSVTASIAGDASSSANYLINDNAGFSAAGLQTAAGVATTLDTGDTLLKALDTYALRSTTGQNESWTRLTSVGNPVFVFDLSGGGDITVGSILLWQYGNNGNVGATNYGNSTRGFSVIFHTEAEGNTFSFGTETIDLTGSMNGIPGDNTIDNIAQLFGLAVPESARYAALRIDTNYLGQPGVTTGGDRYGLGEVRFASEVPEPSAALLGGLGLLALLRRHRG